MSGFTGFTPMAVPTAPVVNVAGKIGEALVDAPMVNAERKAKTAEAEYAAQNAATKMDDEKLSKIAPAIAQNPALANAPALQQILGSIFGRRGLSIPKDAMGRVDVRALGDLISPKVPFDLSPDQIAKVMEQPQEARRALLTRFSPNTIPDEVVHGPKIMSEVSQRITREGFDKTVQKAANQQMTPAEFIYYVNAERNSLINADIDVDSVMKNPAVLGGMAARTRGEIEKMRDLGILDKARAQEAIAKIGTYQSVEELNAARVKLIGAQIHHLSESERMMVQKQAVTQMRAMTYAADVATRIDTARSGSWSQRHTILNDDLKRVEAERKQAETDYRQLSISAQTAHNAGEDPGPELVEALSNAKGRLETFNDQKKQITDPSFIKSTVGAGNAALTGNATKVDGAPKYDPAKRTARSRSRPTQVKMTDGSVWDEAVTPPHMISGPTGAP